MKDSTKLNIIIAVVCLAIGFCISHFGFNVDDTEIKKLLKEKVKSQTKTIIFQEQLRNQDKLVIKKFQDVYIKNDSISDNYTDLQLDSSMSDFFDRQH